MSFPPAVRAGARTGCPSGRRSHGKGERLGPGHGMEFARIDRRRGREGQRDEIDVFHRQKPRELPVHEPPRGQDHGEIARRAAPPGRPAAGAAGRREPEASRPAGRGRGCSPRWRPSRSGAGWSSRQPEPRPRRSAPPAGRPVGCLRRAGSRPGSEPASRPSGRGCAEARARSERSRSSSALSCGSLAPRMNHRRWFISVAERRNIAAKTGRRLCRSRAFPLASDRSLC